MNNSPLSLQDLVRHAVEHHRCQWLDRNGAAGPQEGRSCFENALVLVLDAAEQSDFLQARRGADAVASAGWGGVFPPVQSFREACELAERIDCFLTMSSTGVEAALARSCRGDLNVLAVLADWFAENDRPAAAEEARHLLTLVRLQPGEPLRFASGKPPDWWERDEVPDAEGAYEGELE
jgi:hypothetical protein